MVQFLRAITATQMWANQPEYDCGVAGILRLVCPHLRGSDGSQELHHSPVSVLPVQDLPHVTPGLARPANALHHVLHQNSAQIGSPA